MYTVIYSSTILDKKSWDFIMKVMRKGPKPGWYKPAKWDDPIFMDGFVYAEGDINWYVGETSTLMNLCQVSYRVYTKDRCKLWTYGSRRGDDDYADNVFGPRSVLEMVHP